MSSPSAEDSPSVVVADTVMIETSCSTSAGLGGSATDKSGIDVLIEDIFRDHYPPSLEGSDKQEVEACIRKV